jgi:hypothetical protein
VIILNYKQELFNYINNLSEEESKLLYIKLKYNLILDNTPLTEEEKQIIQKAEEEIRQNKINKLMEE